MDLWTPNNDIAVSIGGKPLFSFKSLRLHQPINDHHRFELALDFEVAAKALEDGTEWLGKRIQIKRREAKSFLFVGVVTQVNACRESLDGGEVRVSGYSTTYLLENGESCHSWLGRTLGEIVRELCAKAGRAGAGGARTRQVRGVRLPIPGIGLHVHPAAGQEVPGVAVLRRRQVGVRDAEETQGRETGVRHDAHLVRDGRADAGPARPGVLLPVETRPQHG